MYKIYIAFNYINTNTLSTIEKFSTFDVNRNGLRLKILFSKDAKIKKNSNQSKTLLFNRTFLLRVEYKFNRRLIFQSKKYKISS